MQALEGTATCPACSTVEVGSSPSGGNPELSSLSVRTRHTTEHQRNPRKYRPCDGYRGQGQPSIRTVEFAFLRRRRTRSYGRCEDFVKTMAHFVANRCRTPDPVLVVGPVPAAEAVGANLRRDQAGAASQRHGARSPTPSGRVEGCVRWASSSPNYHGTDGGRLRL